MRRIILSLALLMAGQSAMASSIEPIHQMQGTGADSIITKSCFDCPPLAGPARKKTYVVPNLTPGTQKVELRDVNGVRKVARTEAWMGGSPVVIMSKPTAETLAGAGLQGDGIDFSATTAIAAPATTPVAVVKTLDLGDFKLRP